MRCGDQLPVRNAGRLLARLDVTRKALQIEQRALPRTSFSRKALATLIDEIEGLVLDLAAPPVRSSLLNLNTNSEVPVKPRISARRQGRFQGLEMETAPVTGISLEEFSK